MSGGANRFVVDHRSSLMSCYWCRGTLAVGEEAAVCQSCGCTHHGRCWDAYGCNGASNCVNRRPADPYFKPNQYGPSGYQQPGYYPPQGQYLPTGYQPPGNYPPQYQPSAPPQRMGENRCPNCGDATNGYCFRCGYRPAGSAFYPVVRETAKEATEAMWCGIIGIFCFGFILGPFAIYKGIQARGIISQNPVLTGEGLATAGIVLGIFDIVIHICGLIGVIANNS